MILCLDTIRLHSGVSRQLYGQLALLHKLIEAFVHGAHTLTGIYGAVDLINLIFPDHVLNGGCHRHDLKYRNGFPVERRYELL